MELAAILLMLVFLLFFFKVLALVFKAGVFVLTIPLQIVGALLGVVLAITLVPVALVTGVMAVVFAPLLILGPVLPLLLIIFGIYLLVKK